MLPRDVRDIRSGGSKPSKPSDSKFPQYIRRLLDFRQMDFEATFDQMLNLLSLDPQRTYVLSYYKLLYILSYLTSN